MKNKSSEELNEVGKTITKILEYPSIPGMKTLIDLTKKHLLEFDTDTDEEDDDTYVVKIFDSDRNVCGVIDLDLVDISGILRDITSLASNKIMSDDNKKSVTTKKSRFINLRQ